MYESLVGQKFGMLTVIEQTKNTRGRKRLWACRCDCGNIKEKPVTTCDLRSGKVRSCGCVRKQNKGASPIHGKTNTRLFHIWQSMKQRCYYEKAVGYPRYGGRGITVCNEWLHDFQAFYKWAEESGYNENLTIDRIENDKGYSPDNCRWADRKAQGNNTRSNRMVEYDGNVYTATQLAERLGIAPATLRWRLDAGWKSEELGITPSYNNKNKRRNQK